MQSVKGPNIKLNILKNKYMNKEIQMIKDTRQYKDCIGKIKTLSDRELDIFLDGYNLAIRKQNKYLTKINKI